MQTSSPGPAMFPLSSGRGVRTQAHLAQDVFQDVFQSRLAARLVSLDRGAALSGAKALSGEKTTGVGSGEATQKGRRSRESQFRSALGATESRQAALARGGKGRAGLRAAKQSGTEVVLTGLGKGETRKRSLSGSRTGNSTAASTSVDASLPPRLKELMSFISSQPEQSLRIPPGQASQVAALLLQAGLPQEEVERLIFSLGSQGKGLTAADLGAAWLRAQGLIPATGAAKSAASSGAGSTLPGEAQEILQNPGYKRLWERLTVPAEMLPTLRLALSRLGASPHDLAQLEGDSQSNGIPLSQVWQILQKCRPGSSLPEANLQGQPSQEEALADPALLGKQPVTGEEMAEWRQLLLKAGLQPEMVEKLLGYSSPATQEELKGALLALAPSEAPPAALDDPKPLYLPNSLRMLPFVWEGQGKGGRQAGWSGSGEERSGGAQGNGAGLAGSLLSEPGEAPFPLGAYATDPQALLQAGANPAGALTSTTPAWQTLSPEMRASLWSQVQTGVLTNLSPGVSQVSLKLNPPELGQIQLTLVLTGQELAVTAVATRPEVAELANQGLNQLLQTLAQQGLVLTQFQVQVKEAPGLQMPPTFASARDKGADTGARQPGNTRRRAGEVDRFV